MVSFLSNKPAQPLIYAICIIIGLLGGKELFQDPFYQSEFLEISTSQEKLKNILNKINEHYVDPIDIKALEEKSIAQILDNLDPHSYYLSSDKMGLEDERLNGNFSGIGVEFKIIDDTIVVMQTIKDGPSFKSDVQVGDKIIAVDGHDFIGDSVSSYLAMRYLKGEKGSVVNVNFLRKGAIIPIEITRGEIPLNSIEVFTSIQDEIGYIKISRFSKRTSREFDEAVEKLLKMKVKSFIIDVRDNPGGLMGSVVEVCENLLDKDKLIVSTRGRTENTEEKSNKKGKLADYPLYVLINENSASASEILAGAVQDHDRGIIIGRRSFGKGLVQRPFSLQDQSALRLTIARYYTPSGRCIQRPYEQGNDYYNSYLINRIASGELTSEDHIPMEDSLKFYTSKGKLVYGGGGIIPDKFVPADTSSINPFAMKLITQQSIAHFFLDHLPYWREISQDADLKTTYNLLSKEDLLWKKFSIYVTKQVYFDDKTDHLESVKEEIIPILFTKVLGLKFGQKGKYYHRLLTEKEIKTAVSLHFLN